MGTLDGRHGSFVLHHRGTVSADGAVNNGTIVLNSGRAACTVSAAKAQSGSTRPTPADGRWPTSSSYEAGCGACVATPHPARPA